MGYIMLAILIGIIIWTLLRFFTHKRIPLNYYSTLMKDERESVPQSSKVKEEDMSGK